jgi:hypothetical protein
MSQNLKGKRLVKFVHRYGTISEAAKAINIPRKTLSDRYHKAVQALPENEREVIERSPDEQVAVDAEIRKAKTAKATTDKKYKVLIDRLNWAEQRLKDALELKDRIQRQEKNPIRIDRRKNISESTAVAVASDWHLEEKVLPETVQNLNSYNLKIAEARVERFFQNILKIIEMTRGKSKIDNLILALLGDFISGYIHEELQESNELAPVEACIKMFQWITRGVDFLKKHGNFKKIICPCCVGNHGRTTPNIRISTEVKNSYEWMVYQFLNMHYCDDPIVQFKIADGYFCNLSVYKYNLRFHHGHGIRYAGGVGGIHIPLNKAIAQWDKACRADIDILGHWHSRHSTDKYVVNGSIIGWNPYAIRIKAEFSVPSQAFFLIHPEKGKTVECPILV